MTKENKIEYIRTKCIEANPSIKDLVRGCYITMYSDAIRKSNLEEADDSDVTCMVLDYDAGGKNPTDDYDGDTLHVYCIDWGSSASFGEHGDDADMPDYEIIGRPIRLPDVLLAMNFGVQRYGDHTRIHDDFGELFERWNLISDDISLQSEATIDLLCSLLSAPN